MPPLTELEPTIPTETFYTMTVKEMVEWRERAQKRIDYLLKQDCFGGVCQLTNWKPEPIGYPNV